MDPQPDEDADLEYFGPGDEVDEDGILRPDVLPGGVDHTTAAVGSGPVGQFLLAVALWVKGRRSRRREGR